MRTELCEELLSETRFEVGYIITFSDGRQDKFGRFPYNTNDSGQFSIFKQLFELEPSVREASYIYSSLRIAPHDRDPRTIEFRQDDIRHNLRRLARPGILCRS